MATGNYYYYYYYNNNNYYYYYWTHLLTLCTQLLAICYSSIHSICLQIRGRTECRRTLCRHLAKRKTDGHTHLITTKTPQQQTADKAELWYNSSWMGMSGEPDADVDKDHPCLHCSSVAFGPYRTQAMACLAYGLFLQSEAVTWSGWDKLWKGPNYTDHKVQISNKWAKEWMLSM